MKDAQIEELFNSLKIAISVNANLVIHRVTGGRFIMHGFTDTRYSQITLTINEVWDEPEESIFSIVLIHELKHIKYPKFSEKIIVAETKKQYEEISKEKFPIEDKDMEVH